MFNLSVCPPGSHPLPLGAIHYVLISFPTEPCVCLTCPSQGRSEVAAAVAAAVALEAAAVILPLVLCSVLFLQFWAPLPGHAFSGVLPCHSAPTFHGSVA